MLKNTDAQRQSCMLSVLLFEDPGGISRVCSVDVSFEGVKHRLSFSRKNRVHDVFCEELAMEIAEVSEKLEQKTTLFADPDRECLANGAALFGVRAMRWSDDKKGRQTMIRFKYFVGSVDQILRARVPFTRPVLEHRERIAVEALADITAPLLGLATMPTNMDLSGRQREAIESKLNQISDRAAELQFYISLLTRYVRECADDLVVPIGAANNRFVEVTAKPAPLALKA